MSSVSESLSELLDELESSCLSESSMLSDGVEDCSLASLSASGSFCVFFFSFFFVFCWPVPVVCAIGTTVAVVTVGSVDAVGTVGTVGTVDVEVAGGSKSMVSGLSISAGGEFIPVPANMKVVSINTGVIWRV